MAHTVRDKEIMSMNCPICGTLSADLINITNDNSFWFRCCCGVVFQNEAPRQDVYDDKYRADYEKTQDSRERTIKAPDLYLPMIEDLTMGRLVLEVGYNLPYNKDYFNDRGWIYFGIDVNSPIEKSKRYIQGDFETFNFPEGTKFNLIWLSHVLEHFNDPIAALQKAESLLHKEGVIYIATPDTDWINRLGIPDWPHWRKKEHYIMWNQKSIKKELERLKFNVLLSRSNYSTQHNAWYDFHTFAQKIAY